MRRFSRFFLTLVVFAAWFSFDANADAGLPMLFLVTPIYWFALFPIIGIEWWILRKKLPEISDTRLMISASVSNIMSTIIGIPIAWVCMLIIQRLVPGADGVFPDFHPFWQYFFGVTVQAPWLLPHESDLGWMVPTAFIFLLIPFYLMSCFIEVLFSVPILKTKSYDIRTIVRSVCVANIWSYMFLLSIGIFLLILGIFNQEQASSFVSEVIGSIGEAVMWLAKPFQWLTKPLKIWEIVMKVMRG